MKSFDIHSRRPLIIAGPCSAETREQTIGTCVRIASTGKVDALRAGTWKPRTKPGCFEGTGVRGLAWLAEAKRLTGLPVAVEAATPRHVESALKHGVDILWIGARTTVSPFTVQDIADSLRGCDITVLVKNPVNPDPDLWTGAVERFAAAGFGPDRMGLVHRGFSYFGETRYRNSPMWHIAFEMQSRFPELTMICDPSHIAGKSEYVREVSQTAADLRFDGLMIESHLSPCDALSDAGQQLTPDELDRMLENLKWRTDSADDPDFNKALSTFRSQIDQIDSELFTLLSRRMEISEKIGEAKRTSNVAILQGDRWRTIVGKITNEARRLNLSEGFVHTVLQAIHIESIARQNKIMNK